MIGLVIVVAVITLSSVAVLHQKSVPKEANATIQQNKNCAQRIKRERLRIHAQQPMAFIKESSRKPCDQHGENPQAPFEASSN